MGLLPRSCRIHKDWRPCDDRTNATYFASGEMIASMTSPKEVSGEMFSVAAGRLVLGAATSQPTSSTTASRAPIDATARAVARSRGWPGTLAAGAGATAGPALPLGETVTGATKRDPRFVTV